MIMLVTVAVMAVVAYCYIREGLFTAFVMCVNVLIAGLLAFNFWEPIAKLLDPVFGDSFLHGYEDAFCLVAIFCGVLGGLRSATNNLAPAEPDFPMPLLRGGGVFFGLVTGYLVSGFLVCVWQTLPWHSEFMGFKAKYDPDQSSGGLRSVLPADRVWLALMHREGLGAFGREEMPGGNQTFDANASFELRYERYRRYTDTRDALPYDGFCPAAGGETGIPGSAAPPTGPSEFKPPALGGGGGDFKPGGGDFKPGDGPKINVPSGAPGPVGGRSGNPPQTKPPP